MRSLMLCGLLLLAGCGSGGSSSPTPCNDPFAASSKLCPVYSVTVATSPNVASTGNYIGTPAQQIAVIAVPALGFATTDTLTVSGYVTMDAGAGVQVSTSASLSMESWIGRKASYGNNPIARNPSSADPHASGPFSFTEKFINTGAAPINYYFSASMFSPAANASSVLTDVTFTVAQAP